MAKLRFGYFIAPFHRPGTNPTLALQRDLEFIEHLDALGYDEAWIGEHHSAGSEIISAPEVFIAAAVQRAKADTVRHRRHLAGLPQPAVGGGPADAARPPHPRPHHRRHGTGLVAHRRRDDRADPH
ncbi:LLM class flavin-dependent oxidoreductase [Mycolicibacterium elephantis]|uniref:LLM class flavin-dependent oxidoreductase n=1 Tax=Mycolicibacterium elephantis TaxID=81858 RepID=UPI0021F34AC0|nr:LLM class flavin-dependent oxidoreductase [Mycolicibacterium elephantis]